MTAAPKYETKKATKAQAAIIADREELRSAIAALALEVAKLDQKIATFPEGVILDTPTHTLLRRPTKSFDSKKFAEAFPATKKPKLYKRVLDNDAVKRSFTEAELDKFRTTSYSTIVAAKEA